VHWVASVRSWDGAVLLRGAIVFDQSATDGAAFRLERAPVGSWNLAEPRATQVRCRVFSSRDTIRVIGNSTTMYSIAPTISGVAFTYCDCRS